MTNNDDINKKISEASETDETGTYSETDAKHLEDVYKNSSVLRANIDLVLYIQSQIKIFNEPINEELKSINKKLDDNQNIKAEFDVLKNFAKWIIGLLVGIIISGVSMYIFNIYPALSDINKIKEKTENIEKTIEKIQEDKQNFEHRLTQNEKDFEYITKKK